MKLLFTTVSIAAALLAACTVDRPSIAPGNDVEFSASMKDFQILEGDNWSGNLTYLNYGSDERSTIPVNLKITNLNDRTLQYAIQYPGEEQYNSKQKIAISRDGTRVDGYRLTSRDQWADGTLVLVTEGAGRDDGRKADIQIVYTISESKFSIRKNVRFEKDSDFFNRNEYSFSR